jgi:hypothetical protein
MENATPITVQGLARAREKPSAQEQRQAMKKTVRRTIEKSEISDASAAVPRTRKRIARRREAPGADFRH